MSTLHHVNRFATGKIRCFLVFGRLNSGKEKADNEKSAEKDRFFDNEGENHGKRSLNRIYQ
jgi:hypothetical protein